MALTRIAESRNRQHGKDNVIQEFGTVYPVPIGLGENVRSTSIGALNQVLADTMMLRDLYKKHHPNSGSWSRIAWLWEDISSTFACRIRPPVSVVADRVGGL